MIPDIIKFFNGGGIPMFKDSGTVPQRKVNVLTHIDERMGDNHFVQPYRYGEHPGTNIQGIYHDNYVFNNDGTQSFEWDGDTNVRRHIMLNEQPDQTQNSQSDTSVFVNGVPVPKIMFPGNTWKILHDNMDQKKINAILGK